MSQNSVRFFFSGEICAPPRSSWFAGILITLLVIGWSLAQVLPGGFWRTWVFCAAALILPLAILSSSSYTVHFNIFLLCYFLSDVFPHFSIYPFNRLTQLILYAYVVLLIPSLRRTVGWSRTGRMNVKMWFFTLAVAVLFVVAARNWVRENSPDLSRYTGMVPDLPFGLLLVYGVGFAAFNAALEEISCRGVMMEALDSAFGAGYWSVVIQALAFGVAHYGSGFPNGLLGSGMTFGAGLILGMIRRKSRGMLACWIIHFFANAAIFYLILVFVRASGK